MADSDDDSQKTEEPTPKRLEDAIKDGNVSFSREVTSFLILSLFTVFLVFVLPTLCKNAVLHLRGYIIDPNYLIKQYDSDDIIRLAIKIIDDVFLLLMVPFVLAIVASVMGSILQNGIIVSPKAIEPKFSKISPLSGFKKIFSAKSVMDLVKGTIKISLVGIAAYLSVYGEIRVIHILHDVSAATIMAILLKITIKMMIAICVIQGIIAGLDYFYERFNYIKKLRMTKQEIKDEYKDAEGDPKIKSKIRALRIQRARQRVAAMVPKADLIITNPTHYAVALKYDPDTMYAPKLIAKGQDNIALQIKEIAKKHDILIVENKPLARSIYDTVDWDEFIQAEHYKAVAEILTQLKKFKKNKYGSAGNTN